MQCNGPTAPVAAISSLPNVVPLIKMKSNCIIAVCVSVAHATMIRFHFFFSLQSLYSVHLLHSDSIHHGIGLNGIFKTIACIE